MRHHLTDPERLRLDERIAKAEKRTGAQIMCAVVERSDVYAELPWKAFALAAAIAGLSASLFVLLRPLWQPGLAVLIAVAATLGAGAASALLCIFVPAFARIFLDAHRAETEVRQYAASFFLSHEMFATRGRTGVLLLVSLFERQVVVHPDAGLADSLGPGAVQAIVKRMSIALASNRIGLALEQGLAGLEDVLSAPTGAGPRGNELPDEVIEEKGP